MTRPASGWMPLYIGDYILDTRHLTTEQHGAYLLLLMECWSRDGVLPVCDATLAKLAKLSLSAWRKHRDTILTFFTLGPDGYSQKRVTAELIRVQSVLEKRRAKAKAAADARWDAERRATADAPSMVQALLGDAQSQSQSEKERKEGPSQEGGFEGRGELPALRVVR